MKKVKNKNIVVIGAARSGVAVAKLLHKKGADVFVSDHGAISDHFKSQLKKSNIPFEENGHTERAEKGDFAVISPGVATQKPLPQTYLKAGKKVYSEIEAASWFNKGPIVAVTGSNGKTTVTKWLDHIWMTAEKDHNTAGNVGEAFSSKVEESGESKDTILEVSSFQLDHIETFHPHTSLLLNITPDHLDRYDNSMQKYAESKFRITENQTKDDWLIYNYDDPIITEGIKRVKKKAPLRPRLRGAGLKPKLLAFSTEKELAEGAFIQNEHIIIKLNNREEKLMPVDAVNLKGTHNLRNGLAAALAARASEIKNEAIRESLHTFEGVEHRLEKVRMVNGVEYVNDSKATNINAVWYALDSFNVPVVLILGGQDKGNDYRELTDQIRKKVHTIIAIGDAAPLIEEQLKTIVPNFERAVTMDEAVQIGKKYAKRGEAVLLSPACASFDMFENYEERGEVFKKAVSKL